MPRQRTTAIVGGDRVGLDQAMLRCRIYRHAWDEFYPDDLGVPLYGWRLSLRCTRCTTERHDVIDHIGQLAQRQYIYPDGYRMARDETPTPDELRQNLYGNVRLKLAAAHAINEQIMERSA
jgi:hypothetical protein